MDKEIKICFVVHNFADYGGVGVVAANLADAFAERYSVSLVSLLDDGRPAAYHLADRVRYIKLLRGEFRLRNQQRKLFKKIRRMLKKEEIDVAVILGHYTGFLMSPVRPFVKTRFVFCDHGALMNQWDDRKNRAMRRLSAMVCDKVITLTERTKEDYIKRFHMRRDRVDCIYNWIDQELSEPETYDIQSKRIVSAGRFGIEKGFDLMVRIFEIVVRRHPDWHLDLYGDGEMFDEVDVYVREHNLSENVHLMGFYDNVREVFGKYAFYAMPSYREGLPVVLLEAKCCRLPIVSFDILTGPGEIIRDGVDGLLIPPYDTECFADAVSFLMDNPEKRKEMSGHSQENLNLFSRETIFRQWEQLILSLADRRGRRE